MAVDLSWTGSAPYRRVLLSCVGAGVFRLPVDSRVCRVRFPSYRGPITESVESCRTGRNLVNADDYLVLRD